MFDLFLSRSTRSPAIMLPPQWEFVKKGLQRNVEKVQQYHRTNDHIVHSDHFLIRLLQTLGVPYSMELERFYTNVDAKALNHAMHLNMTSAYSKGRLFRGVFYGGNNPEVLLATDDYFDFEAAFANWKDVSAVQPLLHPKSDMNFFVPNGSLTSEEQGLAVIQVNVPLLAVQYYGFLKAQERASVPRSITQFVAMYVLPNMLHAHADLAVFNRLYRMATSPEVVYPMLKRHPFSLAQYDHFVDQAIDRSLDYITKGTMEFEAVLKGLPAIYAKDQYDALEMPDMAPTRQVDWLHVAARLKTVDFLLTVCKEVLNARNQRHMNQMLKALTRNASWVMILLQLPNEVTGELTRYKDHLLQANGRDFMD